MPYREKEIEKVKYSIGEVAEACGVVPTKIRFYEKEWKLCPKRKVIKGRNERYYPPEELEKWKAVFNAWRTKKFTVIGLEEVYKTGSITI